MARDRLVFAGSLTIDNIVTADRQFLPPAPGGNVVYSALGALLWHDRIGVVTRAGADFPRDFLARLAAKGLDLDGVRPVAAPHGMNVAFSYAPDGSRTRRFSAELFAAIPAAERPRFYDYGAYDQDRRFAIWHAFSPDAADIPAGWRSDIAALHGAAMPVASHVSIVEAVRGWPGQRVWVQVDSPWYDERDLSIDHAASLLPQLDALLPSEADLKLADPEAEPDAELRRLRRFGVPLLVIKRGADGCEIVGDDGQRAIVPALHALDIIDPTGAGDAFCGGFLAGMLRTGDAVEAARFGTVSASFAIEGRGIDRLLSATRAEAAARLDRLRAQMAPENLFSEAMA